MRRCRLLRGVGTIFLVFVVLDHKETFDGTVVAYHGWLNTGQFFLLANWSIVDIFKHYLLTLCYHWQTLSRELLLFCGPK